MAASRCSPARPSWGRGVKTALIQIAAEQLYVPPQRIRLITADTRQTPDEGYTAGSNSMKDSGTAIMNAAAQVREILIARASERLGVAADQLKAQDGAVVADDGRRLGFGELVGDNLTRVRADGQSKLKDPATYSVVGKAMPRVDIPAKVTGGAAYVQDLRLPGMVHARVVRPPSYGARLRALDRPPRSKDARRAQGRARRQLRRRRRRARVRGDPGDARARRRRALGRASHASRPGRALLVSAAAARRRHHRPRQAGRAESRRRAAIEASYRRPYQMHGAIGPSCAVGLFKDGALTVWTHSQGVYPLRKSIAEMLRLPEDRVQCIHVEGSGCYGHNARGRCRRRRRADRARVSRPAGPRAMDARAGARMGTLRPGDADDRQGSARQRRQHCRAGITR